SRAEPIAVAAFVANAAWVWAARDTGVWEWSLAGILLVLGALAAVGLVQRDPQIALIRTALAVGTLVLVSEQVSGASSLSFVIWLGVFSAVMPFSLTRRHSRFAPVIVAVSYTAVAHLGVARVPVEDAAVNSLVFLAAGIVSYIVAHPVLNLRAERDNVVDRLIRAEGTLHAAFNTTQVAMAVVDLEGIIRRVNHAMCELTRTEESALVGYPWLATVHPEDRAEQASLFDTLVAGLTVSIQQECRLGAGEGAAHGVVGMSLVDEGDQPGFVFVNVADISERVRGEALLRQSEDHYRSLFDLSPVPMWELDLGAVVDVLTTHGVAHDAGAVDHLLGEVAVRSVNEAGKRLIGLRDSPDGWPTPSLDAAAGGRSAFTGLVEGIRRGERRSEWSAAVSDLAGLEHVGTMRSLVPVIGGRPDYTGVLAAFVDATEQQRAEHALRRIEQRLRTVMAGAPILLFAVDANGVFTHSEGQALEALGEAAGEAVGRSIFEMRRDSVTVIRNMRRALGGETFTATDEIGSMVLETRYSPTREGGSVVGVIGVSYDVTDRVRATEQLRELVRSKDEFVATVSHELRTPLTAVVGFANELRGRVPSMERDEIEAFIDLIDEQATEVGDLVEDLLVASRADHGQVPVERAALELWDQVDSVLRGRRIGKLVDLQRNGEVKVLADPIRVRQVVRNLLTNADRYGGDRIVVRVRNANDMWLLDVCDDGPGVPESHRDHIFEPYQRAHQVEGRTDSVGLGLTVSRHLARLMEGELTYARAGEWSVFSLALPGV
ncbi:MAG: PAS domain S-box protein, partial [Acidimicrobiia bacterium]